MSPRLLSELLDLVLPDDCAGCAMPGRPWCSRCAARCGPPRQITGLPGTPPTVAAGLYAGPLRQALLAYKERGRRALADPLAGMLVDAVRLTVPGRWMDGDGAGRGPAGRPRGGRAGPSRCWLVPAPSRPAAARSRGGDHVRALTDALAERLAAAAPSGSVGVGHALRMRGGGRDSVGLDTLARAANLHGRLVARTEQLPPPGVDVLLVDDVVTTGATLRACAATLTAAGVRVAGAVTLCDASSTHRRSIEHAQSRHRQS